MSEDVTLDAVMAVMESGFDPHWREAWTRVQVRESLALPSTFLMLADREARPWREGDAAGFVLSRQALDEEELLLIAVRPEERGRGLGRKLIDSFADAARRRGCAASISRCAPTIPPIRYTGAPASCRSAPARAIIALQTDKSSTR